MTKTIGVELFKLRRRTMTWVLLSVLIGIIVVLYLLLYTVSRISGPSPGPGIGNLENLLGLPVAVPFALSILASFGTVLAIILIGSSTGNEYGWHTIRLMLISSEGRFKFLAGKLSAVLILILIGMAIGVIAGFAMSSLTTFIGGYAFKFGFATYQYVLDQFVQFWRTFFVVLVYVMLAFVFAVIGRSAMAGIAVGIGVLFLEPIITAFMRLAGGWVAKIPDYLLVANVDAIRALNKLPGNLGEGFGGAPTQLPSVAHAYEILGGYIAVFAIVAFLLFRHRDVTG